MNFDARLLSGIGTFVAVAETGSFVRAAETLGLTASGVSRAVARLEGRLGIRLFDRNARATTLTEAGHRFFADVSPLLAGISEACSNAAGNAAAIQGRLRLNCDPWFASLLLAPRLQTFLDAHPALTLDLVVRDTLGDLVSEGFDAAIRFGEPEPSSLVTRKLLETRILTCASPGYLARHGRPLHPHELGTPKHTCLLFRDPSTGRPFDWEFHRSGEVLSVKVDGRLILNDGATAVSACIAGLGIAQPMEFGLRDVVRDGHLVELFPDWNGEYFPLHVYYPTRHLCPAKVRAFIDFVLAEIPSNPTRHVRESPDVGSAVDRSQFDPSSSLQAHWLQNGNPFDVTSFSSHSEDRMSEKKSFKAGDEVKWDTPQGETHGKVVKKETGTAKAGGHTAKASKEDPQYRVKSDKSGKEAIHKPEELKKA